MGFFSNHYDRPGPGVSKDAPKKKGFARYAEMFSRDFSTLWKTSMMLCICSIPLILSVFFTFVPLFYTEQPPALLYLFAGVVLIGLSGLLLGPAFCACHAVILKIVRDEPGFFWHDFKKAWKSCWRQSYLLTGILCAMIAFDCIAFLLSSQIANDNRMTKIILLSSILFSLLIFFAILLCVCLQIVYLDIPMRGMLKNSIFLFFGKLTRIFPATVLMLIFSLLWFFAFLLVDPLFFIAIVAGIPGYLLLWIDMIAWPVFDEIFQIEKQLKERRDATLCE